ncbi:MAG: hypothetical protein QMC85_05840, partial [Methanocellales archaeon]|nr:hypothetical protein [Methanocellales archaeon]
DFAKLIDNLKDKKEEFNQEQQSIIDRFLELVYPFRRIANSKAHNIMVYVNSKEEVDNLKILEIIELVLKLIDKVRR